MTGVTLVFGGCPELFFTLAMKPSMMITSSLKGRPKLVVRVQVSVKVRVSVSVRVATFCPTNVSDSAILVSTSSLYRSRYSSSAQDKVSENSADLTCTGTRFSANATVSESVFVRTILRVSVSVIVRASDSDLLMTRLSVISSEILSVSLNSFEATPVIVSENVIVSGTNGIVAIPVIVSVSVSVSEIVRLLVITAVTLSARGIISAVSRLNNRPPDMSSVNDTVSSKLARSVR